MNALELLDMINAGETSRVQFRKELQPKQAGDIAAEIVAMSNFEGETILVGVEDKTGNEQPRFLSVVVHYRIEVWGAVFLNR